MFEEEGNCHIGEGLMGHAEESELYSVGNRCHQRLLGREDMCLYLYLRREYTLLTVAGMIDNFEELTRGWEAGLSI